MTQPRRNLVCLDDTRFYHLTSRCVRRSFLCGFDHVTGNDYEHRRLFIEQRIHLLASIFAIDILAYAVLSNHIHLVIEVRPDEMNTWSDDEVLKRWTALYKGPFLIQKYRRGEKLLRAEQATVKELIEVYRQRFITIGWFMKCLNEPVARMANQEDGCTGHFWEARYHSDSLLTEQALLTCMAYVDLNPIRAKMAKTPEESAHTSIKERIHPTLNLQQSIHTLITDQKLNHFDVPLKPLKIFDGSVIDQQQAGVLFHEADYLILVDTTGRIIRDDKRGGIPQTLSPILDRLGIDVKNWLNTSTNFEQIYHKQFAKKRRRKVA